MNQPKQINLTLESLLEFLKGLQFNAQIQKETHQVYVILKIENAEFPLFLRIYEESKLLQLLVFMPTNIKPSAKMELARLLHFLNKEMDIPGFGMDEESGVSFYRLVIPTNDSKIDEKLLSNYLNSIQVLSKMFFPAIAQVANGHSTFEDILKKVKAAPKP